MKRSTSIVEHWLKALPKVSLHCHLEGTMRPGMFRLLAEKYAIDLGARTGLDDERFYAFTGFSEFLMNFRDCCRLLRKPEDYGLLASEHAASAVRAGVVAAELFVSPAAWLRVCPDIDVRAVFEEIARAFTAEQKRSGLSIHMICDVTRNFGVEVAEQTVDIALAMRDLGVIGIGLGGDEIHFPAELFKDVFARGRAAGLHCVAHAGEVAGPASVRDAVELLGAERIGHGVRAVDDAAVVRMLARRGIALEQAPRSNCLTGAVIGAHPMQHFVAAGVRVVVDADDPALFGSSIVDEMRSLAQCHGAAFVVERAYDAIAASFAPHAEKQHLFAMLDRFTETPFPEFASAEANIAL